MKIEWSVLKRKNKLESKMFIDKLIEEYFEVKMETQKYMQGCSNIELQADEIMDVVRLCFDRLKELNESEDLDIEAAFKRHANKMKIYENKHDWEVEKTIGIELGENNEA